MLDQERLKSARVRLSLLVVALAVAGTLYRILKGIGYGYTSALFIGIPAILAVIVALAPPAKSLTGTVFRTITFLLLLAGIFAVEGFVCIVMVAPLFYFIGWAVSYPIERSRRTGDEDGSKAHLLLGLPLLLMSFEGVVPGTSLDRTESVSATRIVDATPAEVRAALAAAPYPVSAEYSGAAAVARSLEHLSLGWAILGWTMLLPGLRQLIQLVLDAVGAGPRTLAAVPAPDAKATGE